MRAAVFDSGVGGLTVASSLIAHGLFDEIIYYGDTARVPYGTKDANTVIRYSLEALEFFKNFDVDIMLVACNTVSAYAMSELRKQAPFEVVGVIEPGVLSVTNRGVTSDADILVIGTRATIGSGSYQHLLAQAGYVNVQAVQTGLFVPIVEEGITEGPLLTSALEHYFGEMRAPETVILGCTHFPLIGDAIAGYFGGTTLIHSGEAIVEYLIKEGYVPKERVDPARKTQLKLFATENVHRLKAVADRWIAGKETRWSS